ncbi:MAG TPA: hypothetical protein PLK90_04545 [Clostridiales bacterium]|nr:hypothetical protein [Clostridiales bacterium]HQP69650.1 hypothetical protein [Clostridiales bacterium]
MIHPFLKVIFYLVLIVGLYACIILYFSKDEEPEFNPKVLDVLTSITVDSRTVIISKPDTLVVITKSEEKDNPEYSNDPEVRFITGDKIIIKEKSSR